MCDALIMHAVRRQHVQSQSHAQSHAKSNAKSQSRRDFLKTAAVLPAAMPMMTAGGWAMADKGHPGRVVDMTHTITADFPSYYGKPSLTMTETRSQTIDGYTSFALNIAEHFGTHIDAPIHFADDALSVDAILPEHLLAPLVVIDIAGRAAEDADTQVTPDDIAAWQSRYGDIPPAACVAMHSGWGQKIASPAFRGFDGTRRHFPGFHVETAHMLLEDGAAASLAVDTLSLDHGISPDFPAHRVWLPANRFGVENIANLQQVPEAGATLFIGVPKHKGGSGGQARVLALF